MSLLYFYFIGNSSEDAQGKLLLHNEHSILSLLQDQIGIIQQHGLYREGNNIILILDCLYHHEFGSTDYYKVTENTLKALHLLAILYLPNTCTVRVLACSAIDDGIVIAHVSINT